MYQQKNSRKNFNQFLSHPAWAGISGIVGILALLWTVITFVPQAAPIRAGIAQTLSGTPVSTNAQTAAPNPTMPPLASAEALQENIVLKCSECSDPVVVTITNIKVEPQNNRMIWSITLVNSSYDSQPCSLAQFTLLNSLDDKSFDATTKSSCNFLDSGETTQETAIFSFVPYTKVEYTLTAGFYYGSGQVQFLPVHITF